MLAVSQGRLVALSTPFGQRGWFYHEWVGTGPWKRVQITWRDCPRISGAFIEEERRALGDAWVAQEYETLFTSLEGLVYPDFARAAVDQGPVLSGRAVGGIDFGWRNPFAAVWGVLDRDDVLWLTGERYLSRTPLHEHATALRALGQLSWFADPAGATEIAELRAAGLVVRAADNALRPGIAAVSSRLGHGPAARAAIRLSGAAARGRPVPLPFGQRAVARRRGPGGREQPRPGRPALPGGRAGHALPGPAAPPRAERAGQAGEREAPPRPPRRRRPVDADWLTFGVRRLDAALVFFFPVWRW
jgi:hypothetical protein